MRRALIALSFVGCSAPRAESGRALPIPVAAVDDAGAPVVIPKAPPPDPEPMATIEDVACTLEATEEAYDLRVASGGPRFATVLEVRGSLVVPVGAATLDPRLDLETDRMRLHGFVPASDLVFFPKRPFVLAGAFVPHPATTLWRRSAERGSIVVDRDAEYTDKRSTTVTFSERPSGRASCDDLSLDLPENAFDAESWALRGLRTTNAYLEAGRAIPLARAPAEKAIATIQIVHPDEGQVHLVEKRGNHARIVMSTWYAGVLFGWVPKDALVAPPKRIAGGVTAEVPRIRQGRARLEPKWHKKTCATEVALVAEVGERRVRVGEIKAGVEFDEAEHEEGTAVVKLPGVVVDEDARLLGVICP